MPNAWAWQFGVALSADLRVDPLDELSFGMARIAHVDEVVIPAVAGLAVAGKRGGNLNR